jgi:hypothetical protein
MAAGKESNPRRQDAPGHLGTTNPYQQDLALQRSDADRSNGDLCSPGVEWPFFAHRKLTMTSKAPEEGTHSRKH